MVATTSKLRRVSVEAEVRYWWPRLTRFYGISPAELAELPRAITAIYIDAMPKLEAEELADAIIAADHPHMDEESRASLNRRLSYLLPQMAPPKATEKDLADIGVAVVKG